MRQEPRVPTTWRALNPAGWVPLDSRAVIQDHQGPQHRVGQGRAWRRGSGSSSSSEFGGRRQTDWDLSEWWPRGGQECVPLDAVLGSAEAAWRTKCKKDGPERLTREDPEMLGIPGLPSKPLMFGLSIPPQDVSLARKPGEWLFHGADSRALRRPLENYTVLVHAGCK
ncbi:hypothetical protein PAL_GLEAN10023479 [Pteropus alecto]|uniref:Uncharacterized protein n=1 Tax=Pteropus alecto TaxID=9402 RepID=L5K285_PTEAL|nr:hypothetical protein PAL_GLEAN10023479 [Pteropus alecto]